MEKSEPIQTNEEAIQQANADYLTKLDKSLEEAQNGEAYQFFGKGKFSDTPLRVGDYMYNKSFIDAYIAGDVTLDNIEDYIQYWHNHATGMELNVFLGMTQYEYANWLKTGDDAVLHRIAESRGVAAS